MSKYFETRIDIEIYCPYCKKSFKGYIKENDDTDELTCIDCGTSDIQVNKLSKPYDVPV